MSDSVSDGGSWPRRKAAGVRSHPSRKGMRGRDMVGCDKVYTVMIRTKRGEYLNNVENIVSGFEASRDKRR